MATRYSGDLKITLVYVEPEQYRTSVSQGGRVRWRGIIHPPRIGFGPGVAYDSAKAYDRVARDAIGFADHEQPGLADVAESGEQDYIVRRVPRYHEQYPAGSSRRPTRFVRRDPSRSPLHYRDLPKAALRAISARQRSYIDEFSFYRTAMGIEAWYAGEKLAVWKDGRWQESRRDPSRLPRR